jgi:hypothetical protein
VADESLLIRGIEGFDIHNCFLVGKHRGEKTSAIWSHTKLGSHRCS